MYDWFYSDLSEGSATISTGMSFVMLVGDGYSAYACASINKKVHELILVYDVCVYTHAHTCMRTHMHTHSYYFNSDSLLKKTK